MVAGSGMPRESMKGEQEDAPGPEGDQRRVRF